MSKQAPSKKTLPAGDIRERGLFIDGTEVAASTDELLDVLNPATGEVGTVACLCVSAGGRSARRRSEKVRSSRAIRLDDETINRTLRGVRPRQIR